MMRLKELLLSAPESPRSYSQAQPPISLAAPGSISRRLHETAAGRFRSKSMIAHAIPYNILLPHMRSSNIVVAKGRHTVIVKVAA